MSEVPLYARQGSDGGAGRTTGVDADKLATADKSLVLVVFFFFTIVTGPRRSLRIKLSDTRIYVVWLLNNPHAG